MMFIVYPPLGDKVPHDLKTSNDLVSQILQEFVMLRHVSSSKNVSAHKAIAPWIDQANIYFDDAMKSDWRSGGLLYYYSFLNFAKAYLAAKKIVTCKFLKTTSVYHGLSSIPQDITKLTDFEISIHPPTTQKKYKNVFSTLYEGVTMKKWPFKNNLTIKVKDIAGYCSDIGHELFSLFNISSQIIGIQSLIRFNKTEGWFEMVVPKMSAQVIKTHMIPWSLEELPFNKTTKEDYNDWLLAYPRTTEKMYNFVFLRSPKINLINESKFKPITDDATSRLNEFAIPTVYEQSESPHWLFIPKIQLSNQDIHWHPLLSDYLIAFVLSTILRYQPQLLSQGSSNSFLAEAWCNQSAITALRYFLMLFTNPPLRVETY